MRKSLEIQRENLSRKIIDGTKAIYGLFEELRTKREDLSDEFVNRLVESYQLTENQVSYLQNVAVRARRAQGIIRYLENIFGLQEEGVFNDPEGLHSLLFVGKDVPKGLSAFSENIGISFVKSQWRHRDSVGFVNGFPFDQLSVLLEETVSRLDKNKMTNCANLVFYLPSEDACAKLLEKKQATYPTLSASELLLSKIFGDKVILPGKVQQETKMHELRHVYDYIMGTRGRTCEESAAELYGAGTLQGIKVDFRKALTELDKKSRESMQREEYFKTTSFKLGEVIANEHKMRERNERWTAFLKKDFPIIYKLVKEIPQSERKALSYFFSMFPNYRNNDFCDRTSHRLALVKAAYEFGEK